MQCDYDPIGIAPDLPKDEYDPEAAMIIARVDEANSPEQLAEIMHQVFVHQFDDEMAGPVSRYLDVAYKLWQECERYGLR